MNRGDSIASAVVIAACAISAIAATANIATGTDPAVVEIVKLRSSNAPQRSDAIMKLRYLGMSGGGTAAIPDLIRMLDSEAEFPRTVLMSSSLGELTESCSDECTVGGEAAETLARIGKPSDELLALLASENWRIRANAIRALGGLRDRRAVADLLAIAQRPTERWEVRGNALFALGLMREPSATTVLITGLKDDQARVRAAAATALGQLAGPQGLDPLRSALRDVEPRVRWKAAGSLGQFKDERAVEALIGALQYDPDRVVREVAATALRETGDRRAVAPLIAALKDEYANVQVNAATALGELGNADALEPLLSLLGNGNESVRAAAAAALGDLGDPRACTGLVAMVQSEGRWEIPLERGLEALVKLGHPSAKRVLEEFQRHRGGWIEWWRQNKGELLRLESTPPVSDKLPNAANQDATRGSIEALVKEIGATNLVRMAREIKARHVLATGQLGSNIAPELWEEGLRRLRPERVYLHGVNVVVVLESASGTEQGLYVCLPESSLMPSSGTDGFTFGTLLAPNIHQFVRRRDGGV